MRVFALSAIALAPLALAQQVQTIDACGALESAGTCVVFDGGGGKYLLSDYGNFHVGDTVRVTGSIEPNCVTICSDIDGCISGAKVYDPNVVPCGSDIPNLPTDLVTNACTAASAALSGAIAAGLWFTRKKSPRG
jgi:hypothetical protein